MKVKSESEVAQSSPTLCNPMDCSPPGSSVHGIFQARVLEWGAIIGVSRVLKSPTIIVLLLISPFILVSIVLHIAVLLYCVHIYL